MNEANDSKFLVHVDKVCNHKSLIGWAVVRAVSDLDKELSKKVLEAAHARSGMIDIRIVIEGHEVTFQELDRALCETYESEIRKQAAKLLDDYADDLSDRFREVASQTFEQWKSECDES